MWFFGGDFGGDFGGGFGVVLGWFRSGSGVVPGWFQGGSRVVPRWFRGGSGVVIPTIDRDSSNRSLKYAEMGSPFENFKFGPLSVEFWRVFAWGRGVNISGYDPTGGCR